MLVTEHDMNKYYHDYKYMIVNMYFKSMNAYNYIQACLQVRTSVSGLYNYSNFFENCG